MMNEKLDSQLCFYIQEFNRHKIFSKPIMKSTEASKCLLLQTIIMNLIKGRYPIRFEANAKKLLNKHN